MPTLARSSLVLLLTAIGLAASAALLVDYTNAAPVFCAEGGGCDALRQTIYAHPYGVPLPAVGLIAFLVLSILGVTRGARVRQANVVVAVIGGVIGLSLLVVQLVVGHLCPYCAAVDISAVLIAVLSLDRLSAGWDPPRGPIASLVTSFGLAMSLAAPFLWARHEAGKVPRVIAEELARTPPGMVTIVDFVDFECPFCRRMQATLEPVVAAEKDKIRIVRKLVPLTRIHPHALSAAKAACCADALGKGDAMADALFQVSVEDLTPDGCAKIAESLGLPLDRYRECVASPETDARLAKDRHDFDQSAKKGDGLPLMWVGARKMMGAQDEAAVSRALGEAFARAGS